MGKVITVWGSPGSGKSMFSCILAKALTRDKRKAIIINAEISVPMLPVWLPEQIIQTNASVGQVLSSVEIDTSLVAGHVNIPLPNIRKSDILTFYTKLLKKGFAINSLESINNLIHPTLELAVDDDYIRKNPSKGVYRSLKTEGAGAPPKKRIALTMTQQKNFLRFISKSPMYSHWLPVMVVLLGTGMRVAECTGLTKNDVDLENNTISVNHNLIYRVIDGKAGFHINTPKTTNGTRTIPILYPQVAEQLRTLIEVMDTLYPEDLVMNGYHGFLFRNREGYFLSAHNINRAIQRISIAYNAEEMDQAELEDREPELLPHFSVHNMRHTFCTRLCESTNDIKFIQQVMGHADFSTTMDIYTHITQENMREKAEAIKGNLVLM